MEDNEDDFFSDDGFDDLPPSTLLQLEQNAYQANQAQNWAQSQHTSQLSRPSRSLINQAPRNSHSGDLSHPTLQPPAHLHTGLTNDYGALDVGELDADVLDVENEPTVALNQPVAFTEQSNLPQNGPAVADDSRQFDDTLPDLMEVETDQFHYPDPQKASEYAAEKLEQENERYKRLMEELATVKSVAETKAGEIAIIRSNQAKLTDNYEQQLATVRKTMAEEVARHKEEIEAVRAEGKMLATENAFLKQDLAEESMRISNAKAKGRLNEKAPPVTPKKAKVLPFRDGFEDEEILAVSPSKSARPKRMTPTVPGKRKRRASQDSPTPLQLSPQAATMTVDPDPDPDPDPNVSDSATVHAARAKPALHDEVSHSLSMKLILNHRTFPNDEPDIGVMARLKFPSDPEQTLSTILLEETNSLRMDNNLTEYARAIISLWSRALKEKFFVPVPMFMGIMRRILDVEATSVVPQLIEHLVPVLQESGDVNAIPRFKHSPVSRQSFGQVRQTPLSELEPLVDSTDALGLLFQIVSRCVHIDRDLEKFWRYMRYDFVLMMLNCSQPIRDIMLTLNLLTTSVRAQSFGSVQDTEQDQIANENYIVDRVANLLSEKPYVDEGEPPYTPIEVCNMRLEALSLLTCVAFNVSVPASTHGSSVIASHPTVIARLFRAMHDELDALYYSPPDQSLHAYLVNGLMSLIYGVLKRHPDTDLQAKLGRVAGGKQKFLVVLTRLAFSEGLVLEAKIEDETVEMAHEILDDAVNPQEAEALQEVFSSAKGKSDELDISADG
ncbi:hypothetical protein EYZ11_010493 [Aspergillus tanneri]|uniref:DNA repair protein Rad26 n=1 Tax=Aspergillus tanneri TaxID=1220188 RepID=A0A4S3J582_9EURO|nr:uncharacterized protein ATNIH1004_006159 [Aspergillus tanneri]KAA8647466.1 hypothetical protein ATNIH1004_006159 [Aspergillus tanneri]THC90049.1 hypothetical protein EYZ11_010493 [Aspergillus tanneri]